MMPFFNARFIVWRPVDSGVVRLACRFLIVGLLFLVAIVAIVEGADADGAHHTAADPADVSDQGQKPAEDQPAVNSTSAESDEAPVASGAHETPALTAGSTNQAESSEQSQEPEGNVPYFLQDDSEHEPVLGPEQQIAALTRQGMDMWGWGNHELAEEIFARALSLAVPMELKRSLLLDLANLYDTNNEPLKVTAVLEKFRTGFPGDRLMPHILLKLGLAYRETGAYDLATQRFFQVLNSTLQAPPEDLEQNRRLAMKARLEIAATYDMQGKFEEAEKYFSRVQLFALDPADRERVQFRSAQLVYNSGAWLAAEEHLKSFVQRYPESVNVPEARYLRAKALDELDRKDEAVQEVMAILQTDYEAGTERARMAAYWGRRTGNELANQLYEQGDFLGALSIYQALARANDEPAWRWPAVYQVGLCFERLGLPERALEAYELIVSPEESDEMEAELSDALDALQEMAHWRLEHLDWVEDFSKRIHALSAKQDADT